MPTAAAFKPEYQPFEVKREHLVPRNPLGAGQVIIILLAKDNRWLTFAAVQPNFACRLRQGRRRASACGREAHPAANTARGA